MNVAVRNHNPSGHTEQRLDYRVLCFVVHTWVVDVARQDDSVADNDAERATRAREGRQVGGLHDGRVVVVRERCRGGQTCDKRHLF